MYIHIAPRCVGICNVNGSDTGRIAIQSPVIGNNLQSQSCILCLISSTTTQKGKNAYIHLITLCLYAALYPHPFRISKRFCTLCQIMQHEKEKKRKKEKSPSNTFSLLFTPWPASPPKGVSLTVAHHVLNIHQRTILFPATNATGRRHRSFQSSLRSHFTFLKLQI